jgi:hypothetical protein
MLVSYFEFGSQAFCEDMLLYGWSKPERDLVWSDGAQSAVTLPYSPPQRFCSLRISFVAHLLPLKRCSFYAFVNGTNSGLIDTDATENQITINFDGNSLAPKLGINIVFVHLEPARPAWLQGQSDGRLLNIALRKIEVISDQHTCKFSEAHVRGLELFSIFERQAIRDEYLRQLRFKNAVNDDKSDRALSRAISFYVRGLGGNQHDRSGVKRNIEKWASEQVAGSTETNRATVASAVKQFYPSLEKLLLLPHDHHGVEEKVILEGRENEYHDPDFSKCWQQHVTCYLSQKTIQPESIYQCRYADFVVSDRQYMIIDQTGRYVFRGGNPAGLSPLSVSPNVVMWEGATVLLQDQFDCGNIAHFLFDSAVRMYHWCNSYGGLAKDALFIFGGIPLEFHRLVLMAICEMFDIPQSHILFPREMVRIRSTHASYWFSSQVHSQHPANMMRRESCNALQSIARRVLGSLSGSLESGSKIIISRSDANLRRLANEDSLTEKLERHGFTRVVMSELSWEEQIKTVAGADVVVAPHGMGLTALAFNQRRPKVIEMFNPTIGTEAYTLLSKAYENDYHRVIGLEIDPTRRDFIVDIDAVMELL